jgi:hypothetical protein
LATLVVMSRTDLQIMMCAVLVGLVGCADSDELATEPPEPIRIELPAVELAAGQESTALCQSATLNNDEPLYVNAVHMQTGPGWHHSNWFFVPEGMYQGADGTWVCRDRNFDTLEAGLAGGVLFAQSTQASEEVQKFQPGVAVVIPPRSRIVGDIHLLNAADTAYSTAITLDLQPIAASAVTTELQPATLIYFDLDIPAQQRSRFAGTCDLSDLYGGPLDFRVHYVLPHYHGLGESLRLEAAGGDREGQVIYEKTSAVGEPLGGAIEPPFDLSGAGGMRFSCTFDNRSDASVGWGIGDQEMCVVLAFVDSAWKWIGAVQEETALISVEDGLNDYEGPCRMLGFPVAR